MANDSLFVVSLSSLPFFVFFFFSVSSAHSRSPHLPGFPYEASKEAVSCSNEFLSVSLSGNSPENLLNHSFKAWDRVSSRLGYLSFVHSVSASIEMRRDLDYSGSNIWKLNLRAKPCASIPVK